MVIWKRFRPEIQAYVISISCLAAAYILFYATYFTWSGDYAWGDRFITVPIQLLAMISIPLLLRHRYHLRRIVVTLGMAIAACSVAVQLASVAFWHPLEIHQMETLGHRFVVGLRFKNIAAVAFDSVDQWGLSNQLTKEVDGIHSITPYFLPFLSKKDGSVSRATSDALIILWFCMLAALISTLLVIWRQAQGDFSSPFSPTREPG
jgi:hypothetical protein